MKHRSVDRVTLDALWPPKEVRDELECQHYTAAVIHTLYEARLRGDWDEASFLFDCLAAVQQCWPMEPQLSILENSYAQGAAYLAHWLVGEHDLVEALNYAEAGWTVLATKNDRRRALGLQASPSSDAKGQLLGAVCDAKWRLDERFRDRVIHLQEHVPLYLEISAAFRQAKAHGSVSALHYQQLAVNSLWTGLWVAAASLRFEDASSDLATEEFDRWHIDLFGHSALHPDDGSAPEAEGISPWSWHYKIVSRWLREIEQEPASASIPQALKELASLYANLAEAVANSALLATDITYRKSLERDHAWMAAQLRQRSFTLA